jgi:feruloyl esterase
MENLQKLLPEDSLITEYAMLGGTDGVARVCRIVVESRPTESSLIRTAIWLPDDWNGIFVGLGNGGIGGNIGGPTLISDYAKKSFACATTDMGTSKIRSGERKTADAELWKDYAWRSTHVMTVVSKLLIAGYYGREPQYSYFFGASAGGLQAFSEAQRFPEDYDGILAGVPSNNALNLIVHFLWMHVNLRNKDGKSKFAPGDAEEISRYAAAFFSARGDGEPGDDFVTYSYTDANTVADFLEFLHRKAPRFTPQQLKALEMVYNGPVHKKTGEQKHEKPLASHRNHLLSAGIHAHFMYYNRFIPDMIDPISFFMTEYPGL